MNTVIAKIVSGTKRSVLKRKRLKPLATFKSRLKKSDRDFKKAISGSGKTNIIAEIKFASPSEGKIASPSKLTSITKIYDKYASAISVLTEEKFFQGSPEYLGKVRSLTDLPILQKDFILDEYQVYEARRNGADAVLLISSLFSGKQIDKFLKISKSLGMDCLVEMHTEEDLKKVLKTKAEILGINNRNLDALKTDISTTQKLLKKIPKYILKKLIVVSESGFSKREDVESVHGVNAFLIGTELMRSERIQQKLKELAGLPLVKICGITRKSDALAAAEYGADIIGFVFYEQSPRYIAPEKAKQIIDALPGSVQTAGIFVNYDLAKIKELSIKLKLDYLQLYGQDEHLTFFSFFPGAIKAIQVSSEKDISNIDSYPFEFVLLDANARGKYGGTGKTFDWKLAKKASKKTDAKVFLAGGLNAKNVKQAIMQVRPYAVDASSKLEKELGIKDHRKIKEFIEAVYS